MDLLKRQVRVTHPFHPRSGEELEVVLYRRSWGRDYLDCHDAAGRLVTIPVGWTDAAGEVDPFVVIAAGRSFFRVEDLLQLAELLQKRG